MLEIDEVNFVKINPVIIIADSENQYIGTMCLIRPINSLLLDKFVS